MTGLTQMVSRELGTADHADLTDNFMEAADGQILFYRSARAMSIFLAPKAPAFI